jgi:hypothetical protein
VNPNDANVVLLERAAEHLGYAQHRLPDKPMKARDFSVTLAGVMVCRRARKIGP